MADAPKPIQVALVGDSTLDNVVWLEDPTESVPARLRELLGGETAVLNYAADGFTSQDVLQGQIPSISYEARLLANDPFPVDPGDAFYPLIFLMDTPATHAVLSIGGNDVRIILGRMELLGANLLNLLANYPKIVDAILSQVPNLMICLQYRPCYQQTNYHVYEAMEALPGDETPVWKLNKLMESIYPTIFQLARERGLPIVDLARSFDIYNAALYRSQIEPSGEGAKLIAELIHHVLTQHDWTAKQSTFYYRPPDSTEILTQPNDGTTTWSIDSD